MYTLDTQVSPTPTVTCISVYCGRIGIIPFRDLYITSFQKATKSQLLFAFPMLGWGNLLQVLHIFLRLQTIVNLSLYTYSENTDNMIACIDTEVTAGCEVIGNKLKKIFREGGDAICGNSNSASNLLSSSFVLLVTVALVTSVLMS